MRILAIETSCDETAVAVVSERDGKFVIEKNLVASQMTTHAAYGGVVPEVAARMHVETLVPMLAEANIPRDGVGIDAIAVTAGPGLVVALRVGVETAKTLSLFWQKPLIPVHHLAGHIASAWLGKPQPIFPVLALVVSGGHTELVLMRDHATFEILGKTRDDAAGEAFDKVAKLLHLGYPGGPAISKLAKEGKRDAIPFTRPMMDPSTLDFSFSGLKTAVLREVANHQPADVAASFEECVVDTLVAKTFQAVDRVHPTSIIVVGGVSANARLRERMMAMCSSRGLLCIIPDPSFSTDNAAMIAAASIFAYKQGCRACAKGASASGGDPRTLVADPHLAIDITL